MNNRKDRDITRPILGGPQARGRGPMGRMHAEKPKNAGRTLLRLLKYIGSSKGILIAILSITVIALFHIYAIEHKANNLGFNIFQLLYRMGDHTALRLVCAYYKQNAITLRR